LSYEDKIEAIYKWLEFRRNSRVFVAEIKSNQLIGFAVGGLEIEEDPLSKGELWGIYFFIFPFKFINNSIKNPENSNKIHKSIIKIESNIIPKNETVLFLIING
jgi:hypothetical protein